MRFFQNPAGKKDKRLGSAHGRRAYDLPLHKSVGTGFLVLLIAMMTFLAVMALAAAFNLGSLSQRWSSGLENRLTVEIPAERENGTLRTTEETEDLAKDAAQVLGSMPEILSFTILDTDAIQDLISPWLGDDMVIENIPLPGIISVEMRESPPQAIEKLRDRLADLDPTIRIDTHESWLGDLLRLTGALQFAATLITLIIGATTITAVAGAIRTRMAVHSEDVELLHLMGASDTYIMKQFRRHAQIIALKGSAAGTLAAGFLLLLLMTLAGKSEETLLPEIHFDPLQIAAVLMVPATACLIAAITARFTVLRVLSLMP